jgi:anti-sigma factor RsiW
MELKLSKEDELLVKYLREAAPALAKAKLNLGPHPKSSTLAAYCQGELDGETSRHVRVHLLYCDECFEVVHRLEQICEDERKGVSAPAEGLRQVLTVILTRLQRLAAPPAPAEPLALAAAGEEQAPQTWELYEEAGMRVGVSVTSGAELVVTLESERQPVADATVTLERVGAEGAIVECARGQTDLNGEVNLGLLEEIPPPRPGERYQVKVVLPTAPER